MSVKDSQKLKQLETRLTKAVSDHTAITYDFNHAKEALERNRNKVERLKREIKYLKEESNDVIVTEHAILRYVERCMGFNLDQIRNEILTDSLKASIKAMGNGKYPVADGCKAIVKNNTIITIS
jgi:archaellum component FlaC